MELEFVRFGGLSKVNHKKLRRTVNEDMYSYHYPPVNKGIYAFIYPYIENFLWVWKLNFSNFEKQIEKENISVEEHEKKRIKFYKSEYRRLRKKFKYTGMIWTHFNEIARKYNIGIEYTDTWVKIHTNDLEFLLKMDKHETIKETETSRIIVDPYKRGLGGYYSRDHLEVFIEKVN